MHRSKPGNWSTVAWAALLLFIMVRGLTTHDVDVFAHNVTLIAVGWVTSRILFEGFASIADLFESKRGDDE
jgi:hypothetical protein